ncbi:unnamed protein product [Hymenolepis diminuta]|uniref:Uncharacterized protein n=1 Tax=Hymenolepis diminuta TaxID=6216 RepID=A0A564XWJ2_HYMDI|nr:unnamed protein product [Hymenolepis diminuta]
MERRTDFDMKAIEPAEVVDVVVDVGEEVGGEEGVEDDEFVVFVGGGITLEFVSSDNIEIGNESSNYYLRRLGPKLHVKRKLENSNTAMN